MSDRFVYFDLGNVLVKFDHAIAIQQIAALSNRTVAETQHALFDSGLQVRYETGLVSSAEFAEEVNKQLHSSLSVEDILEAASAIFIPNEEILPVLHHVRSTGIRIGLLSNTCEAHWVWILRKKWPMVDGWFDPLVLSYEVRSMKPDRAIYEYCEKECGLRGSQIFFTDDRVDNITAAQTMGWSTYQFGSPEGLISAFDAWRGN